MAGQLQPLLRQLSALDTQGLRELQRRCTALLSLTPGAKYELSVEAGARPVATGSDYLLLGIHEELRRRGLLGRSHWLPVARLEPRFEAVSAQVRAELEGHLRPLKQPERVALGNLAARALAEYLAAGRVPINATTLLRNVSKVPQALDGSFPGYLAAGLLPICWGG